jgi:hypothetical protein
MATVKGILVNDGGAPARIINFVAAAAISAGEACTINGSGKASLTANNNLPLAGVALTDAASGGQCSLVTGSGVVLYVMCKANVVAGDNLMTDEAVPGSLLAWSVANDDTAVAIALEASPATIGLTKVLVF